MTAAIPLVCEWVNERPKQSALGCGEGAGKRYRGAVQLPQQSRDKSSSFHTSFSTRLQWNHIKQLVYSVLELGLKFGLGLELGSRLELESSLVLGLGLEPSVRDLISCLFELIRCTDTWPLTGSSGSLQEFGVSGVQGNPWPSVNSRVANPVQYIHARKATGNSNLLILEKVIFTSEYFSTKYWII